jgi:hypothetical protein
LAVHHPSNFSRPAYLAEIIAIRPGIATFVSINNASQDMIDRNLQP